MYKVFLILKISIIRLFEKYFKQLVLSLSIMVIYYLYRRNRLVESKSTKGHISKQQDIRTRKTS